MIVLVIVQPKRGETNQGGGVLLSIVARRYILVSFFFFLLVFLLSHKSLAKKKKYVSIFLKPARKKVLNNELNLLVFILQSVKITHFFFFFFLVLSFLGMIMSMNFQLQVIYYYIFHPDDSGNEI